MSGELSKYAICNTLVYVGLFRALCKSVFSSNNGNPLLHLVPQRG